jgi:hypothetical protein
MADSDIGVEWRQIPDFPDYEISPAGQVRRSLTSSVKGRGHPGNHIAQMTTAKTGPHVRLYANRSFKDIHVHVLLRALFPDLYPPDPEDRQEWRTIHDAPEYEVSDQGQVRRCARGKSNRALEGLLLRQHPGRDKDYSVVILFVRTAQGIKRIKRPVHRLVLEEFHGPRPVGFVGRHLDGDTSNNSAQNLAWGTVLENVHDKYTHGTMARGERVHCAKLTPEIVKEIKSRLPLKRGERIALARKYGTSPQAIGLIALGRNWRHVE